jgi:hypothetical protein
MKLLRLHAAIALVRGVGIVVSIIAGPAPTFIAPPGKSGNTFPTFRSRRTWVAGKPKSHPAGLILLASLTGLAICFVWIWINGRAWR